MMSDFEVKRDTNDPFTILIKLPGPEDSTSVAPMHAPYAASAPL
jgi:hypothetical protein